MNDNKKKVLTFSADVHPDGSQITTQKIYDSMTDVQAARRDRELAVKANHDKNRAVAKLLIAKNNGSDIQFDDWGKSLPNPGAKELADSRNTFDAEWRNLTIADLYTIIPQYEPPSNILAADLQRYQELSRVEVKVVESETAQFLRLIPNTFLNEQDEHCLAPTYWLNEQMSRLHVRKEARDQFNFNFQRMSRNRTEGTMWTLMISIYNGHVKSIVELQRYA